MSHARGRCLRSVRATGPVQHGTRGIDCQELSIAGRQHYRLPAEGFAFGAQHDHRVTLLSAPQHIVNCQFDHPLTCLLFEFRAVRIDPVQSTRNVRRTTRTTPRPSGADNRVSRRLPRLCPLKNPLSTRIHLRSGGSGSKSDTSDQD
jgi:hypothetical protein